MIVYVTPAEGNGGILQFSTMMARETKKIQDCILFVPDTVEDKFLTGISEYVQRYTKVKTVNGKAKGIVKLCQQIVELLPDKVIFLEDSVLMQQMNMLLRKADIITAIVIHDVVYHPTNKMTWRRRIVERLRQRALTKTINTANYLILLSDNSVRCFRERHPVYKAKTIMFRLGAHVPNAGEIRPKELETIDKFILFFGRIDKYKGIGRLCKSYSAISTNLQEKTKLVIAGRGELLEEDMRLINDNSNVILINRFIEDEEMIWMMKGAEAIAIPYIEASQSGVLPIAYHYGKPVISSNLPGLVENILDGKTGIVFNDDSGLVDALEKVCAGNINLDDQVIHGFYIERYNWEINISKLLNATV